ncbi:hypothetical protein [Paenibacillus sp. J2TS4]|uniref:hypothetical protein n=1 Tax=Paenibacillus sp. J2TS4 TaxID=2807194 RepID=UPI001B2080AA|nr:hypothetical protein [Paenibacillus sp. J2TS4]GIP32614.1 hypothetical protein J2TS4_18240 [Paenibacillus sp. J2TS4]
MINHFSQRIFAEWGLQGTLRSMVELLIHTEEDFHFFINRSKGNSGRFFFTLHEIRRRKLRGMSLTFEEFERVCRNNKRQALERLFLQKITDDDLDRLGERTSQEIFELHSRLPLGTTFSIFALYLD